MDLATSIPKVAIKSKLEWKQSPDQTPLPEPLSQILEKLCNANLITRVQPKPMTGLLSKNYDRDTRCAYHMHASSMIPKTVRL